MQGLPLELRLMIVRYLTFDDLKVYRCVSKQCFADVMSVTRSPKFWVDNLCSSILKYAFAAGRTQSEDWTCTFVKGVVYVLDRRYPSYPLDRLPALIKCSKSDFERYMATESLSRNKTAVPEPQYLHQQVLAHVFVDLLQSGRFKPFKEDEWLDNLYYRDRVKAAFRRMSTSCMTYMDFCSTLDSATRRDEHNEDGDEIGAVDEEDEEDEIEGVDEDNDDVEGVTGDEDGQDEDEEEEEEEDQDEDERDGNRNDELNEEQCLHIEQKLMNTWSKLYEDVKTTVAWQLVHGRFTTRSRARRNQEFEFRTIQLGGKYIN